ncbi:MAG: hydrolase [Oscillospiraceae bacterium]|jgi:nicotinamidase-related amidase|nr:hydrolase [Oscillospiraceae bacterium]
MRNYPDTLLDPARTVIAVIDHQPQMYFGAASAERRCIMNNAAMLMETAKVFGIPCILTTVEAKEFSGDMICQLADIYPDVTPIDRTCINAWEDTKFRKAVEATGKREIILAGLWTEACVTFPALAMRHDGYKVYACIDACGGSSKAAHNAALTRMSQAGVVQVTAQQCLLEFQRDWANKETYDKVMQVVKEYGGAYGIGAEYAESMVQPQGQKQQKQPQTAQPKSN